MEGWRFEWVRVSQRTYIIRVEDVRTFDRPLLRVLLSPTLLSWAVFPEPSASSEARDVSLGINLRYFELRLVAFGVERMDGFVLSTAHFVR
jgi:hypothetical protein